MEIGSEAHKELFWRTFLETYQDYDPYNQTWPHLDDQALPLVRRLPCWETALPVETKAMALMDAVIETALQAVGLTSRTSNPIGNPNMG